MNNLKLYIDSAKIEDWEKWTELNLFYGITTNPLLLEKSGIECNTSELSSLANKAFSLGINEFQIQLWGTEYSKMYTIGCEISKINPEIVIKIPISIDGIKTAHKLIEKGIKITFTGIYNAYQYLIASKINAKYAAPYFGRMNEVKIDGFLEIDNMNKIKNQHQSKTEILVASLRTPQDISNLAAIGLKYFTINPNILDKLFCDKHTNDIIQEFEKAIKNIGGDTYYDYKYDRRIN